MKEVINTIIMMATNLGNIAGVGYLLGRIAQIPGSRKLLRTYGRKKWKKHKKWLLPALLLLLCLNLYSLLAYQ